MIRVLRQIWTDPVGSKVIATIATAILAAMGAAAYHQWTEVSAAIAAIFSTASNIVVYFGITILLAVFAGCMVWLIGRPLYSVWWARRAAFLSFRDAAARHYERTKAADVLFGSAATPDARLGYHAARLVHYAKFGKAKFYGKKMPSTVMEPVPQDDLWTGKRADNMRSWITEGEVEFTDLSLRHDDLRRIVRLERRAVKCHNALPVMALPRLPDNEN
jgi:hypothetical protein